MILLGLIYITDTSLYELRIINSLRAALSEHFFQGNKLCFLNSEMKLKKKKLFLVVNQIGACSA